MSSRPLSFTATADGLRRVLATPIHILKEISGDFTDLGRYNGIWDTGATGTVVTQKVIDECGLIATGMVMQQTANGSRKSKTYLVNMGLPNRLVVRNISVAEAPVTGCDILVGMDIISRGDFAVTNVDGKTVFTYRFPSLGRIDFVSDPLIRHQRAGRNEPCPCGSGKKYKKCCGKGF